MKIHVHVALAAGLAAALAAGRAAAAADGGSAPGPRRSIPLDGEWGFRRDGAAEWKTVRVPSSFQEHEGPDFHGVGWYRRKVPPLDVPSGKRVLLHFQAAATSAEVSFDGKKVGSHLGGWTPFRVDVTDPARAPAPEGGHEIEVRLDEKVGHNTQGFLPVIAPHFGGIWQSASILIVPDPYIDDLNVKAIGNPATGRIEVEAPIRGSDPSTVRSASLTVRLEGSGPSDWLHLDDFGPKVESGILRLSAGAPNGKLWSPHDPAMYGISVDIDGKDRVESQAALRKLETKEDGILLDGSPLQVRGVLNWGYYPPENYPKLDEARFRRDIELIRSWGFNLMKFCLWVPPRRYLDICDEMGMLAWMEYPTWHPSLTKEHREDLRREFAEFFALDRNHPAVILRSLTCETGSGADMDVIRDLYDTAHRMIPGSLVEDDSSWIGWNRIMDFYDDHPYGNNHTWLPTLKGFREFIAEKKRTLPLVLGECMAADTWVPREELVAKVGDARPFWIPGFLDDSARWLDRMRDLHGREGLVALGADSLRYGMLMRKYQAEAFRREIPAGGYVMSVMRDFSTAAMGFLDCRDQPKWTPADWAWQGDTCLLLATESDRRSFASQERFKGDVIVSHFGRGPLPAGAIHLKLAVPGHRMEKGILIPCAEQEPGTVRKYGFEELLPEARGAERFRVEAELDTGSGPIARNSWPFWLCPGTDPDHKSVVFVHPSLEPELAKDLFPGAAPLGPGAPDGIVAAARFDDRLVEVLEAGGKVLLLPDGGKDSLPLTAHWFLRGAPYVPPTGYLRTNAMRRDLTDFFVELQHFDLASDVIHDIDYLEEIDPVLLLWDTHDLKKVKTHALAFAAGAGKGRLLVSALRHGGATNSAGRWLLAVLLGRLAGEPGPTRALAPATWRRIKDKLHEEKIDLVGRTWQFKPDPKAEGLDGGWHLPATALDDSWKPIKIGLAWEAQGWPDLDRWAWYRLTEKVPAAWAGRDVYLSFEGVDDIYELFVNGVAAGKGGDLATHRDAFNEKKSHRITDLVRPGEDCVIAVRVYDWFGAGGIFRPVTLSTAPFHDGPEVLKP